MGERAAENPGAANPPGAAEGGKPGWYARSAPLTGAERAGLGVLGGAALALLLVAALLRPDPAGHGTHRQLGLAPCTLLLYTGYPCPSCGMTTSWSRAMHGDLVGAARVNFGGTLLAGCALVFGAWAVVQAAAGRCVLPRPSDGAVAMIVAALLVVTLVDYGVRLYGWRPTPASERFADSLRSGR